MRINRAYAKILRSDSTPKLVSILILAILFVVYCYTLSRGLLPLTGHGDMGARFLLAASYARDFSHALNLNKGLMSWLGFWPPVPFIVQGLLLRFIEFTSLPGAQPGLFAVQLLGVFLTVCSFYVIGRAVAVQVDEPTGLLVSVMCLAAPVPLRLAPTDMAEVYTLLFTSLGILGLCRLLRNGRGLILCPLAFVLAFFCRTESIAVAGAAALILFFKRARRPAMVLTGVIVAIVGAKVLGAMFFGDELKFWNYTDPPNSRLAAAAFYCKALLKMNGPLLLMTLAFGGLYMFVQAQFRRSRQTQQEPGPQNWQGIIGKWYRATLAAPAAIWGALLVAAVGVIVAAALRGQINWGEWRFLYLANVLLTTFIAVLAGPRIRALIMWPGRFRKLLAVTATLTFAILSLGSGFAHATGHRAEHIPQENETLIAYIADTRQPGDRVVYDVSGWQEFTIAAHVLDPRLDSPDQLTLFMESTLHRKLQNQAAWAELPDQVRSDIRRGLLTSERGVATVHAYVHYWHPRLMVLEKLRADGESSAPLGTSTGVIRRFLHWCDAAPSMAVFQSPYVEPGMALPFVTVWENSKFVVLERLDGFKSCQIAN